MGTAEESIWTGRGRRLARGAAVLACLCLGVVSGAGAQERSPAVLVTTVDGAITPVVAAHLSDGIGRAERGGYEAYLVRMDTPGGLDTLMRAIIRRILSSRVPVVVYVAPQGARATSAGAIIAFSSHVAAMAPGTVIGASTPVNLEGGDVERKVVNDSAAFAESLARLRGRNVDFAGATVRDGRSAPADEAVAIGAVDLRAGSIREVLAKADGRVVTVEPGDRRVSLRTAGAAVDRHDLGLLRRIQQRLADPNLAYLFLSIGTLALIYELAAPGIGGGGVVGVTLILLALFALAVLPVNAVGLLLLGVAAALFVAELLAPGVGVAAAGGTAALVLAGVFLFRDTPDLAVSLAVILPVAAVVGGGVLLAGRLVVRSQRGPSKATGDGLFVGRTVTVARASGAGGQAFVEGAWWRLRSTGSPLVQDTRVRVVGVDGLDLVVEPVGSATDDQEVKDHE